MSTQQNDVPDNELAALISRVGPFFEEHGNKLLLGLSAILLVAAAWIYFSKSSAAAKSAGWSEMNSASSAEDFHNIAEAYPDASVGNWARLSEADTLYRNGVQLTFSDRASSRTELEKAAQTYDQLLAASGVPDLIRRKALFGKAQCIETMVDGDTSKAVTAWKTLVTEFPESTLAAYAEERIADLAKPETVAFYSWFSKQDPKPSDIKKPADAGAAPFGTELRLPDTPKLLQLAEPVVEPEFEDAGPTTDTESPADSETPTPDTTESDKPAESPAAPETESKKADPEKSTDEASDPKASESTETEGEKQDADDNNS